MVREYNSAVKETNQTMTEAQQGGLTTTAFKNAAGDFDQRITDAQAIQTAAEATRILQ